MEFPLMQEVTRYRDMTTVFGGYNHQLSCQDGEFFDMKNMTAQYYPILSPRQNRGIVRKLANPQGILDKENLMWIDSGKLYVDGDEIALEGVVAPRVSGRVVAIGADCEIELVQYSEQVEISPEAKVGRTERI